MYDPETKKIIISRDVVFDEMEKWDWKKSGETNSLDPMCKENEENQENKDSEDEGVNLPEKRVRRKPVWMTDYESGAGLSDEENEGVKQLTQEM